MTGAGALRETVNFQEQSLEDDGFGNMIAGDFETVFATAARIRTLKGGETVTAGRLNGTQTHVLTCRWQPAFDAITTAWRAVNSRTNQQYEIRAITPDERKAFVDVLCETGTI